MRYVVLRCACAQHREIPWRLEWAGFLRDDYLTRFRCEHCGQRPRDVRIIWKVEACQPWRVT